LKNLIAITAILLLFVSCKEQPIQKANVNTALVKQYFAYFNTHEWTKMASMYVDTAAFKDPSLGPGIIMQSREQVIEKYSALNKMFPDIKDSIIQLYPSGDKHIIVEFISKGKAPDNTVFQLPICTVFTIENGLITKDFTYFDNFEEK
jgi:predicted SnoaL-like aldol condensation-catalyzing enzyme